MNRERSAAFVGSGFSDRSSGMHQNTAILILSHVMNREVMAFFKRIKKECSKYYDVIFLCDNTAGVFDSFEDNKDFFLFTTKNLQSLNYVGRSAIVYQDKSRADNPYHKDFNFTPGSTDMPVLLCYKRNPSYDFYWIVEYDVRFSGSWNRFFSFFAKSHADLLGTTLTPYADIPGWYHWPSMALKNMRIGKEAYLRGFFPIYRLSNRALARLDRDYLTGVRGHYECLLPTLLHHAGMTIEDIGGDGPFVRPENRNRFYSNTPTSETLAPGSFVFRPVMTRAGKERDTLWHPVKYTPAWRIALRRMKAMLRRRRSGAAPSPNDEHLDALAHVEQGTTPGGQNDQHQQHGNR
jgi:hypothetical protein